MKVTVTGGAGYVGACVAEELLEAGHDVVVLDVLLHGQEHVEAALAQQGAAVIRGDIRDGDALRRALKDADAVVHLAAIVGDPACARDPQLADDVNVEGSAAVVAAARRAGAAQLIFASTCSNYGRMADPTVPVDETAPLAPVSLYAEQKVAIERRLLGTRHGDVRPTCLRFATVYGTAPRMRFDLTVNEFTRDLWSGRRLEVFGEQFWRPYVHVRDAARAVRAVLAAPAEKTDGEVFNVGHTDENYRKLDLVELITGTLGRGDVSFVRRDEDPRDYKVAFEKVHATLGFEPRLTVPAGIREIVAALAEHRFGDPFDPAYSNLTSTQAPPRR
ncbi:MAG TPA: NAD(P)-dependent oxidoreductase [Solirubrobacteraceae bacterium]|nr:NAD(P)-dependent oxidoreductase [Solirubrobacteraceae bacterium]